MILVYIFLELGKQHRLQYLSRDDCTLETIFSGSIRESSIVQGSVSMIMVSTMEWGLSHDVLVVSGSSHCALQNPLRLTEKVPVYTPNGDMGVFILAAAIISTTIISVYSSSEIWFPTLIISHSNGSSSGQSGIQLCAKVFNCQQGVLILSRTHIMKLNVILLVSHLSEFRLSGSSVWTLSIPNWAI